MRVALDTVPEEDIHGNNTGWLLNPFVRRRIPSHQILGWISTYSQPVQQETIQPLIDQIFDPPGNITYLKNKNSKYAEKGRYHWLDTELAHISFKWQQADVDSYTGANLDLAMLDEPHARNIYYEIVSRLVEKKGRMWTTLTPVIDAQDPDIARKMRNIRWMKKDIIDKWEHDPKSLPLVDVIYADIEENPHVDTEFALSMWASLSAEERLIRKTGRFFDFLGASCFDAEQLIVLEQHLRTFPEVSAPRYGMLEYDDRESSEEWKIRFVETAPSFADEPNVGWIWKIWEEPVDPQLGFAPEYAIGVDAAGGDEAGEYTSVTIKRCDSGRTVAALHGFIDEIELARQLWLAGYFYCKRTGYVDDNVMGRKPAKLAVETVNIGKTTVAYLITGHDELGIPKYGRENMYRQPEQNDLAQRRTTPGRKIGWYTSTGNRHHLISGMRMELAGAVAAIENGEECPITDIGWISEAKNFIFTQKGKYEHAPACFDDRLFSSAIADKVVEQVQARQRKWVPREETEVPKELWCQDEDGEIYFNTLEARRRAGLEQQKQEVWY
jgi:hypothetical protein